MFVWSLCALLVYGWIFSGNSCFLSPFYLSGRPQRRKHKSNTSSTKCSASLPSAQGASVSHPVAPEEDSMKIKVSSAAEHCVHRKHQHRHRTAPLCHSLPHSSPDQQGELSAKQEGGELSSPPQQDSDTDLSDSERLPLSSCPVASHLELRPEVIEDEEPGSHSLRDRGRNHAQFDFSDFLPPPFNSWSLSQLAVFYNTEGVGAPRPRPVGALERYLERLLQLEWYQIQTVLVDHGTQEASGLISSCQRSTAAAPSRLSSPKCILQCQRAFPLTFLPSLACHSALLSACACALCRICSSTCNRSIHSHSHQSRLSPMLHCNRGARPFPRRSYSESRVHSTDRTLRNQTSVSPTRTNSYLRRMQASGNIRHPIQGASGRSHSSARGCNWAERGNGSDRTVGVLRKRSGSEQGRGGGERQQNGSEKGWSSSPCRKGRAERGRAVNCTEQEIKPDAVTAILDHLPGSGYSPVQRPVRAKQVGFVT
ncbi:uncharacterized protein LOC105933724 isoform X2 [Fundulus heteroclitus]|uniref:uncharacterized protein LOC105933724 isoform X2 n=1 Tax=Fundulus heteroclitus TaxID=8078 RepID=UPI00165A2841|nr:uncharacterized protein LOC105933724 isoform X2 [Fundulus heteroclitus]